MKSTKMTKEQQTRPERIRVLVTLDSVDYKRVREMADENGLSFSSWVRQLIKKQLRQSGRENP
jgi:predicted DNA binding CopG/RHH family protein